MPLFPLPFAGCAHEPDAERGLLVAPIAWASLDDVPEADGQTPLGRVISDVRPWAGGLYLGFGDFGRNTGPIPVVRVEVDDGAVSVEAALETEEIYAYTVYDGILLTTAYDRLGEAGRGGVFQRDADGAWSASPPVPKAVHVWNATGWEGALWVAANGFASRSEDGGETWTEVFRPPGTSGDSRAYELAARATELVLAGVDRGASWAWVTDGVDWTRVTGLPDDGLLAPIATRGQTWLVRQDGRRRKAPEPLGAFALVAGKAFAIDPFPGRTIQCWTVDPTGVVWLVTTRDLAFRLHRSEDLERWTDVARFALPERPSALGVEDGIAWIGTEEGRVWRIDLPDEGSWRDR